MVKFLNNVFSALILRVFSAKTQKTLNVGIIRKYDEEKVVSFFVEKTFSSHKIASLAKLEDAIDAGGSRPSCYILLMQYHC